MNDGDNGDEPEPPHALKRPLRRAAGERKGPVAKQRVGEVVCAPKTAAGKEVENHLTRPALRAGLPPLPPRRGRRGPMSHDDVARRLMLVLAFVVGLLLVARGLLLVLGLPLVVR